jgi:dipeptidyl aminopeptidase/acylaminoacyl peptidase
VDRFRHLRTIEDPILLIHGEADNHSGTFPIPSGRFYMALKGNGKTVRYAARESNMHVLYEWITWFDKYVKNAKPRQDRAVRLPRPSAALSARRARARS